MHCYGKLKWKSLYTSYCLIKVATKVGLTNCLWNRTGSFCWQSETEEIFKDENENRNYNSTLCFSTNNKINSDCGRLWSLSAKLQTHRKQTDILFFPIMEGDKMKTV